MEEENPSQNSYWIFVIALIAIAIIGGWSLYSSISGRSEVQENSSASSSEKISEIKLNPSTKPRVGAYAPEFRLEDIEGNIVSLSDFRGKKNVLVVFWAIWCGFCKKELPDLKDFTRDYKGKIEVLALDIGASKEELENYKEEKEINFRILLDKNLSAFKNYWVTGTPSHFFIDEEGIIRALRPGYASRKNLDIMAEMLLSQ